MTSPIHEITSRLSRPLVMATWVFDRLADSIMDRQFGIDTSRRVATKALGFRNREFESYQPFSYLDFAALMRRVPTS